LYLSNPFDFEYLKTKHYLFKPNVLIEQLESLISVHFLFPFLKSARLVQMQRVIKKYFDQSFGFFSTFDDPSLIFIFHFDLLRPFSSIHPDFQVRFGY